MHVVKVMGAALLAAAAMPAQAAEMMFTGDFGPTSEVVGDPAYSGPAGPAQSFSLTLEFNDPPVPTSPGIYDAITSSFNFGSFASENTLYAQVTVSNTTYVIHASFADSAGETEFVQFYLYKSDLSDYAFATFVQLTTPSETSFIYRGPTFTSESVDGDFISRPQSPVPEPASWALMIAGFALAGGLTRAQRAGFTGQRRSYFAL